MMVASFPSLITPLVHPSHHWTRLPSQVYQSITRLPCTCGLSLEKPTAHGPARGPVVPSGAFASRPAGHPSPEAEQLQQVVPGADQQPLPVHLRQTPQQELPESPALLDLAEHRFHRLHPEGVAFPAPFRSQLAPHPVPGRQSLGYAAKGRRWRHPAVAGPLRRNERVHSQGV